MDIGHTVELLASSHQVKILSIYVFFLFLALKGAAQEATMCGVCQSVSSSAYAPFKCQLFHSFIVD